MLELCALTKRLGSFRLEEVDLLLEEGEYFVLLGPSGSGKTVLLELIAGLLAPDSGALRYRGEDITARPPEERGFGLVYQDYALFPHLSVERNLAYGLRARRVPAAPARERAREAAGKLGITPLLARSPETLSGGEQQRVALARALVQDPPLLLLDEPLAALDTNTRIRLRRELKRVQREAGTTFLHVTHDPEEALYLADRVGVLLGRRLRQIGTPEDLFRRPSDPAVGEFLGMRNVLPVSSWTSGACRVDGVEIQIPPGDQPVTHLWIKPEEILLSAEPFSSSARNQFRGRVIESEPTGMLLVVRVDVGGLELSALVTHESHGELRLEPGREVYCTFKSSAVHCF